MPDITMCQDHWCPSKQTCYRFVATLNQNNQSYFMNSPRDPHTGCQFYYACEGKVSNG